AQSIHPWSQRNSPKLVSLKPPPRAVWSWVEFRGSRRTQLARRSTRHGPPQDRTPPGRTVVPLAALPALSPIHCPAALAPTVQRCPLRAPHSQPPRLFVARYSIRRSAA